MDRESPPRSRLSLALSALIVAAALGLATTGSAGAAGAAQSPAVTVAPVASPADSAIASAALAALGSYEGECFPWVRRIVEQATGRTIGWGYRDGYLEAGATEVSLAEARPGDIIQLADDAYSGASADYAGLHTAIVLERLGSGRFNVIDSNSEWAGIVRLRPDYDPLGLAARYSNISVHVYRIPGGSADASATGEASGEAATPPAPAPAAAGAPPPTEGDQISFQAAGTAIVNAGGDCLRLRSGPGLAGAVLTCIPDGSQVTLLAGSQQADGFLWQLISHAGNTGWAADQFLIHESTPPSAPTPTPTPTLPPVVTPTPTPTPPPAPTPTAGAPTGDSGIIGEVPRDGGLGLIVFGGGTVDSLVAAITSRGCSPVSVWANQAGGGLVGLIPGAPAVVNVRWNAQFGNAPLEPRSPLIIVCRGAGSPTVSAPPPGGIGSGPPGPAGNE